MFRYTLSILGVCGLMAVAPASYGKKPPKPPARPNILFVVMDDVGIDQMQVFGYDLDDQPPTPTIDQIAGAGVMFRNAWSMPACSTSRAVFFDGRFPFRTNVLGALGPDDLANSMVSPFETTAPKLLAKRGYESALFGKFHIALQGHDPAGLAAPHSLGWNFFAGWMDETGDPSSIDKTAGGVAPAGTTYSCGFVPSAAVPGGADHGACYMANGSCTELVTNAGVPPGRTCRDQGGILVPDVDCGVPGPIPNFSTLSSHFVSPVVYNFPNGKVEQVAPRDPRSRTFRAKFAVDEAISWINGRPTGRPWMATVSFASDHTPLVQPPADSSLPDDAGSSDLDCGDTAAQRQLSNLLIESLDSELGRLLVQTGLATQNKDGSLKYQPAKTNTMVIVIGDNGSLGTTVKLPFDSSRAKGTAYQTGVWVPLVIAGPLVSSPNRTVTHMVNIADLFSLFGEIAGIKDVRREVAPRILDAEPMLGYLENPGQPSIRRWNFTQVGVNLQINHATYAPCTIGTSCTQIPVSQSVCMDNNGVWWGEGHDDPVTVNAPPAGYTDCCQAVADLIGQGKAEDTIEPLESLAIRDDHYKIVQNSVTPYVSQAQPCGDKQTTTEFYKINEDAPFPTLDEMNTNLDINNLSKPQRRAYDTLSAQLATLLASEPDCPGDGNGDLVVDKKDLRDWRRFAQPVCLSSVYDFYLTGCTDPADEAIITQNLGLDCRPKR
jgi:sulfatase-like protein